MDLDYVSHFDGALEFLSGKGAEMSAMQEERYNLSKAQEAQDIVEGNCDSEITLEHARCLLEVLKTEAPELFSDSYKLEGF